MTIAIGAQFDDGIVICADSMVTASDGATTSGVKAHVAITPTRHLLAVANAGEDGRAAEMLAGDIQSAAFKTDDPREVQAAIKRVMGKWYRSYGAPNADGRTSAPVVEFIVGEISDGRPALHYCQPPGTILSPYPRCISIGRGARPVDPLLSLLKRTCGIEATLLKIAYLMAIAKSEEGSACGGETHGIAISKQGEFAFINRDEMAEAERLGEQLREQLGCCCNGILSGEFALDWISEKCTELRSRATSFRFPNSLRWVQHPCTPKELKQFLRDRRKL